MQEKSSKQHFTIHLELKSGKIKKVEVKAKDLDTAIRRAMKFNPEAVGITNA